jgi:ATP-dependent DNA ligase
VLFASDLIEHDGGDLRDLPLIDRKRRLAELIGKETAQYACRSQRERAS